MNVKKVLLALPSVIYFAVVMTWAMYWLIVVQFALVDSIKTVRRSGFATTNYGIPFLSMFGLAIGISLLIPILRKMYYKLPWLFAYVKIFYTNVIILSIALVILNYGYEVQNETRHTVFFILAICAIVIGRVLMSLYFHKKNVAHIGGRLNG
jgi:hypothetical protein